MKFTNSPNSADLKKKSLFIRTNYGDDAIALLQWLFEAGFTGTAVYVDTGFAAASWQERVVLGEAHARRLGFEVVHLHSKIPFSEAVLGRGSFPSVKFQWCTGLLKGLPFVDWLESVDKKGEGVILIAKRKASALAHATLNEWIPQCEFHGDRALWHPMIDVGDDERNSLLQRAGFTPLHHRSLECEPCVNSTCQDWQRIQTVDAERLHALEVEVNVSWSEAPTATTATTSSAPKTKTYLDLFYRGCGNHFGCGI